MRLRSLFLDRIALASKQTLCFSMTLMFSMTCIGEESIDLLAEDDFAFEIEDQTTERNWTDGFRFSLSHQHSQQLKPDFQPDYQRSKARIEYEWAPAEGWYVRFDNQTRYFWDRDQLARRENGDRDPYAHNKLQAAWVQYSSGACSHKLGRQALIWGEVEGIFAVDVVTPFDLTEQLFTDYSTIRRSQDMLLSECYGESFQVQAFVVPEAELSRFQHRDEPDVEGSEIEFGGRLKYNWQGGDASLMLARLESNNPSLVFNGSLPVTPASFELATSQFNFVGLSSSIARGRLLLKADVGYLPKQLVTQSSEKTDQINSALGFEYTTSNNHQLNAGLGYQHFSGERPAEQAQKLASSGWNKTYLNDDLSMSLLAFWLDKPKQTTVTFQGEYQWNDYVSTTGALSISDLDGETISSISGAEQSLSFSVEYIF